MDSFKRFMVNGDCWCPGERTLRQLILEGHTDDCAAARRAWDLNRRRMSEIERERKIHEAIGRQIVAQHIATGGDQ